MANTMVASVASVKTDVKLDKSYDNIEIIYCIKENLKTSNFSKN